MYTKQEEFLSWLADVKGVVYEHCGQRDLKEHFESFCEDYNTATMPSKKYYNIAAWHANEQAKGRNKKVGDSQANLRPGPKPGPIFVATPVPSLSPSLSPNPNPSPSPNSDHTPSLHSYPNPNPGPGPDPDPDSDPGPTPTLTLATNDPDMSSDTGQDGRAHLLRRRDGSAGRDCARARAAARGCDQSDGLQYEGGHGHRDGHARAGRAEVQDAQRLCAARRRTFIETLARTSHSCGATL